VSRPRALDLFCGAGGAAMGLHRAGFDVTGVDIRPQPRYPFGFVQADALRPPVRLGDFDFIWASPPCQAYSIGNTRWGYEYPDLIAEVRALLADHPLTTIENVPDAPIRADIVLTGLMFDLPLVRRRHFEVQGFRPPLMLYREAVGTVSGGDLACVAGHGANRGRWDRKWSELPAGLRAKLRRRNNKAGWSEAMGIDWMARAELAQAIPPDYAEFVGRAALHSIRDGEVAA